MILMLLCRRNCSIYSKAANRSAPEKPKRKHEVLARHERVSLGPVCRRKTQFPCARGTEGPFVGVIFLCRGVLGNCNQVRARLRSEERRVGKEGIFWWFGIHL